MGVVWEAVLMAMRLVMGQAVKRVPSRVLFVGRVVVMRMLGGWEVALAEEVQGTVLPLQHIIAAVNDTRCSAQVVAVQVRHEE